MVTKKEPDQAMVSITVAAFRALKIQAAKEGVTAKSLLSSIIMDYVAAQETTVC